MKTFSKLYKKKVSIFSRLWVTVSFGYVACGLCSACLSAYRLACLAPHHLTLRRNIFRCRTYYANMSDDSPF